jgi:hypothetical protein
VFIIDGVKGTFQQILIKKYDIFPGSATFSTSFYSLNYNTLHISKEFRKYIFQHMDEEKNPLPPTLY